MSDVIGVINNIKAYLIFIGIVVVLAIVATITVRKMKKPKRKLIRSCDWLTAATAVTVAVNMAP